LLSFREGSIAARKLFFRFAAPSGATRRRVDPPAALPAEETVTLMTAARGFYPAILVQRKDSVDNSAKPRFPADRRPRDHVG
jgi:hypothetical protein